MARNDNETLTAYPVARGAGGALVPSGGNPTKGGELLYRDICGKCGATRIDRQLGLEPTPEEYVARMVEVFREVRRVLANHGTVWLNVGDSYAGSWGAQSRTEGGSSASDSAAMDGAELRTVPALGISADQVKAAPKTTHTGTIPPNASLKPKDLVGIPWRLAFALQADGWYLRSDIIWAKANPMPESVTDRPTKSHEYVFLLSKRPRYFFDQEAVREKYDQGYKGRTDMGSQSEGRSGHTGSYGRGPDGRRITRVVGQDGSIQHRDGERWPNGGRNVRSVWEIATQPYPNAHFATFPEELVRRCILAGCPEWVCGTCGIHPIQTQGRSSCGHGNYRPGVVLDPFVGSGTTCLVARKHGRHSIGIDLSEDYLKLAAERLQQQSLFAEADA